MEVAGGRATARGYGVTATSSYGEEEREGVWVVGPFSGRKGPEGKERREEKAGFGPFRNFGDFPI